MKLCQAPPLADDRKLLRQLASAPQLSPSYSPQLLQKQKEQKGSDFTIHSPQPYPVKDATQINASKQSFLRSAFNHEQKTIKLIRNREAHQHYKQRKNKRTKRGSVQFENSEAERRMVKHSVRKAPPRATNVSDWGKQAHHRSIRESRLTQVAAAVQNLHHCKIDNLTQIANCGRNIIHLYVRAGAGLAENRRQGMACVWRDSRERKENGMESNFPFVFFWFASTHCIANFPSLFISGSYFGQKPAFYGYCYYRRRRPSFHFFSF